MKFLREIHRFSLGDYQNKLSFFWQWLECVKVLILSIGSEERNYYQPFLEGFVETVRVKLTEYEEALNNQPLVKQKKTKEVIFRLKINLFQLLLISSIEYDSSDRVTRIPKISNIDFIRYAEQLLYDITLDLDRRQLKLPEEVRSGWFDNWHATFLKDVHIIIQHDFSIAHKVEILYRQALAKAESNRREYRHYIQHFRYNLFLFYVDMCLYKIPPYKEGILNYLRIAEEIDERFEYFEYAEEIRQFFEEELAMAENS